MSREFDHTMKIDIAGNDVEIEFSFTATPVVPATWDDPAEGGEIEISNAFVLIYKHKDDKEPERHEAPMWLLNILSNDSDITERLYESISDAWDEDPDDYRDDDRG